MRNFGIFIELLLVLTFDRACTDNKAKDHAQAARTYNKAVYSKDVE